MPLPGALFLCTSSGLPKYLIPSEVPLFSVANQIVSHPPIILSNVTKFFTSLGLIAIYTYKFTWVFIWVLSPSLYKINPSRPSLSYLSQNP